MYITKGNNKMEYMILYRCRKTTEKCFQNKKVMQKTWLKYNNRL